MKTNDIIVALEGMSGINEKRALIKDAFLQGNREFFIGARLAYDKLVSFGVKKVPSIEVDDDDDGTLSFSDFIALTNRLKSRELTGHAARDAIIAAAERSGPAWNLFYRRVLLKDLQVRVSDSIINKVLKDDIGSPEALQYVVPVFECQLAEDSKKHPKKMKGRKLIDIKLDGARMLTVLDKDAGEVRMYTRSGIETDKFDHIRSALLPMLNDLDESIVLDGEILGDTFQGLMTQMQRKDADTKDMKLGLFDFIPLKDFKKGKCLWPQDARHDRLCNLATSGTLQKYTGDKVYVIPKLEVDLDTAEGQQAMRDFFNEAVAAGFEGIMIKDPSAGYEGRKYSAWLKWKPSISVTLKVVDLEQGKPDSEFHDTLGALVCEGVDDVDGKSIKIKTNCGSGFPIEQRREWWDNPSLIKGFLVEIEADAATLNQNSTDTYSLRFPRFKGMRGTVPGEKI